MDDAIYLTRRSLELQPPDQSVWLQHFTLGEILKASGQHREASQHLQHALQLNPSFLPAQQQLREIQSSPDTTVTYYTLFIIIFLILGVLAGVLTSFDGGLDDALGNDQNRGQRHFNRAMAMRSIRLGINPRLIRARKGTTC